MTTRRSEAGWREECLVKRGDRCRCCRLSGVQMDHMIPKGVGGSPKLTVVENGLPLCRRCHEMKTEHRLLVRPEWLDEDQILWLAEHGYAWWDDEGEVHGERRRIFADRTTSTGASR